MAKRCLEPAPSLFLTPVVMVTCQDRDNRVNIITLAWVGVVNSEPPMIGIAVRPSRFSHGIIRESGEFVVNVPSQDLVRETDFCGITSGEKVDKLSATGLTAVPAKKLRAPLIQECPVNLECVVRQILGLGSHDLFIGEVVMVHAEETVLGPGQSIDLEKARPFAYCPGVGQYWNLKEPIGTHGFTRGQF